MAVLLSIVAARIEREETIGRIALDPKGCNLFPGKLACQSCAVLSNGLETRPVLTDGQDGSAESAA